MVFHRFIEGDHPTGNVDIVVNGEKIHAWNPFAPGEPATVIMPEQVFELTIGDTTGTVRLTRYVLPPRDSFNSVAEFERMSGPLKWNRQQGLYIYRVGRLVQWSGWAGIRAIDEPPSSPVPLSTSIQTSNRVQHQRSENARLDSAATASDAGTPDQRPVSTGRRHLQENHPIACKPARTSPSEFRTAEPSIRDGGLGSPLGCTADRKLRSSAFHRRGPTRPSARIACAGPRRSVDKRMAPRTPVQNSCAPRCSSATELTHQSETGIGSKEDPPVGTRSLQAR